MQPKDRQARTGRAAAGRPDQVRRAEQYGDLSVGGWVNIAIIKKTAWSVRIGHPTDLLTPCGLGFRFCWQSRNQARPENDLFRRESRFILSTTHHTIQCDCHSTRRFNPESRQGYLFSMELRQGGSRCSCCGSSGCRCCGSPSGSSLHRCPNCRRGSRGSSY
jgi:hypothetical protein